MTKRLVATIIVAIMLFTLPLSAFAAEGETDTQPPAGTPKFSVESVSIPAGQKEVTVSLRLENVVNYLHLNGKLIYDNSLILSDFVLNTQAEQNTDANFETAIKSLAYEKNTLRHNFSWTAGPGGASGTFTLAYVTFLLPENAPAGTVYTIDMTYEPYDSYDAYDNDYRVSIVRGTVTLADNILYGDVNRDAKVDLKDVSFLLRRLAGYETEIDLISSDVNLDYEVDFKDVSIIIRNLAGWKNARLGHRDIAETTVAPTCSQKGQVRLTCSVCGDTAYYDTPTVDHIFENGYCTMCSIKSPDYPVTAYCNYLKYNAPYDENLRGYAKFTTKKFDGYSVFTSNIYDDKTDSLCLFGTINFDSGLYASVSIDIGSLRADGKYDYYYECYVGNELIATISGKVGPTYDVSDMTSDKFSGDESMLDKHMQIASPVVASCHEFTAEMLAESGLDLTIEDFNIKLIG